MHKLIVVVSLLSAIGSYILVPTQLALAQAADAYPDMRGEWKGTNDGLVLGSGRHHRESGSASSPRMVHKEFTIKVSGQEGRKFWGEIISSDDTDPFVAVFAIGGRAYSRSSRRDHHRHDARCTAVRNVLSTLEQRYPGRDILIAACNEHTKQ